MTYIVVPPGTRVGLVRQYETTRVVPAIVVSTDRSTTDVLYRDRDGTFAVVTVTDLEGSLSIPDDETAGWWSSLYTALDGAQQRRAQNPVARDPINE